nr:MAG TPA: hypothetical protein [Caudoviricetes sp.]
MFVSLCCFMGAKVEWAPREGNVFHAVREKTSSLFAHRDDKAHVALRRHKV